jgi:hypothetical protein
LDIIGDVLYFAVKKIEVPVLMAQDSPDTSHESTFADKKLVINTFSIDKNNGVPMASPSAKSATPTKVCILDLLNQKSWAYGRYQAKYLPQ